MMSVFFIASEIKWMNLVKNLNRLFQIQLELDSNWRKKVIPLGNWVDQTFKNGDLLLRPEETEHDNDGIRDTELLFSHKRMKSRDTKWTDQACHLKLWRLQQTWRDIWKGTFVI